MNLKAIKPSYGDFGRVQRGAVLKDVSRDLADKLLKSGAYVEATAADLKEAAKRRILIKSDAELRAAEHKAQARADTKAAAEAKAKEEAEQKAKAEADAKAAAEAKAKEEAEQKAKAEADAKAAAEAKAKGQKS